MKKEDILALDEFRETYGDKAADALVQYLTKKRKDLTAHEVLEDDGAFERFSNWAYTKLHVDVYEKFAKHDVGGFFKRSNVEGFRKMRPGVDPNYNYFLRDLEGESKDVEDISQLDDREIAKTIADQFKSITNVDISDIFNKDSSEPDTPLFNQDEIDKTVPSIKKWLDGHGIPANHQDDILYELDDVLSTKFQEMDEDPLVVDSIMSNESIIGEDDAITLTFGQLKKLVREFREKIAESDDDDYEVCAKCGAEIDPCDAYYVDASEPYCSEECLNAAGYTLDDVLDDTQIDSYDSITEDVLSQNVKDIKDEDISKVYDELKKTGKTDDEIGKVIGGIISTKQESTNSLSRPDNVIVETWDETDAQTYWNGNGKYQDIANRLSGVPADKLIEKFKIPYATASKFDRDRIQYYRFFNDGDTPTVLKKDITDKYGKFPAHCDLHDDELFNFIAPRLEALIDTDLKLVKPYVDKVQDEDTSIEETAVFKKQLIIGDNNDGTITIMLTSQPSEDDKKMLRTLSGDENMDFKKDPEYSYWYASIKGKTPKEAEEQISQSFPDYAIEIDNDQDQIA